MQNSYPAAPGSSPKHTHQCFYHFSQFVLYLSCEKNENKQKNVLTDSTIIYARLRKSYGERLNRVNRLRQPPTPEIRCY